MYGVDPCDQRRHIIGRILADVGQAQVGRSGTAAGGVDQGEGVVLPNKGLSAVSDTAFHRYTLLFEY